MNRTRYSAGKTDSERPVFAGFRRVLRQGALIFALILLVLFAMSDYQRRRAVEAVRSVDDARQVLAAIDALRIYLLNLDTAVRNYAESRDPAVLAPDLICRHAACPSADGLIVLVRADAGQATRLAPLPALQAALETGFSALRQRAQAGGSHPFPEPELSGFDKSAIEQIHRILIEAGREELRQLELREQKRVRDQTLALGLVGLAGLWTGLALIGLYRETTRLIAAGIEAEATIRHLSLRDPLTGLPNRRFLQENEKHWFALARRAKLRLAVLIVDLDDFKPVNDRLGHAAGDAVLKTAAQRMQQLLREADVVARFGGDEFVIVLGQVADAAAACQIAARVVESLCQPMPLANGATARIGASVGVALGAAPEETLESLIRQADAALYEAKRGGKNTYRLAGVAQT